MRLLVLSSFIQLAPTSIPVFTDFQTRSVVQTLISQPNVNQIKHFVDQNLRWLTVNRKIYTLLIS